jgi:Cdc6-like AAA superfamily ATPase
MHRLPPRRRTIGKSRTHRKRRTHKKGGADYTVKGKTNTAITITANPALKGILNAILPNGSHSYINTRTIVHVPSYFEGTSLEDGQKDELQSLLLARMGLGGIEKVKAKVEEAILSVQKFTSPCNSKDWKSCSSNCRTILSKLIMTELTSTPYMIRALSASILWANSKKGGIPPVTFTWNRDGTNQSTFLTGTWEDDKKKITMNFNNPNTSSRLIMGFGPSASGKTYWAQTLINLFSKVPNFPQTFISIDGGIYRESSMIYQLIIDTLSRTCMAGFTNLVNAGIGESLFTSQIVKDAMMLFLKKSNTISLYVPETLGSCGWGKMVTKNCRSIYEEYITLTGDTNWIGLLIWQHQTGADCTYEETRTCKGCKESGEEREMKEGKKYSSSAYTHSLYKSWKHMTGKRSVPFTPPTNVKELDDKGMGAPGGQFMIHNTGGKITNGILNQSTILDYSEADNPLSAILNTKNKSYVYEHA